MPKIIVPCDEVLFPVTHQLVSGAINGDLESMSASILNRMLDRAFELALFPLIYMLLDRLDLLSAASERQRQRWVRHRIQQRVIFEQLRSVCNSLQGTDFLILKGLSLARRLYGSEVWRATSDIDVLIRSEQLDAALSALKKVGFTPAANTRPEPWAKKDLRVYHSDLPVMLELHWSNVPPLTPSPSTDDLLRRRSVVRVRDELDVPVLGPEDGLLQACYHFHSHVGFLKGLFDIAGWLDSHRDELDFALVRERAASLGITGILQWPLLSLERLTGLPMPIQFPERRWAVELWTEFTVSTTRGALSSEENFGEASALAFKSRGMLKGHSMAWKMAAAMLLDEPNARFRGVWERIFLGPEAMAMKLGKAGPDLETWARVFGRPAELVVRQIYEVLFGPPQQSGD